MKNINLNEKEIDTILNSEFDKQFWIYQLGISVSGEVSIEDNRFIYPFYDEGNKFWIEIQKKVYKFLCDPTTKEPNTIVYNIIDGDARILALSLFSSLTSHLDLSHTVTIPIVALLIKNGVRTFCKGVY